MYITQPAPEQVDFLVPNHGRIDWSFAMLHRLSAVGVHYWRGKDVKVSRFALDLGP